MRVHLLNAERFRQVMPSGATSIRVQRSATTGFCFAGDYRNHISEAGFEVSVYTLDEAVRFANPQGVEPVYLRR